MKAILCYGDSITWGYDPVDGSRFPFEQRWPGVLEVLLGGSYRVIEEGLGGRTVATDSWVLPHRDGRSMLGPLLETHAPLDWVVILLGTNDCGPTYRRSVEEIAFGCATLLWTVQKSFAGPKGGVPQMLLVAPPPFGKFSPLMELFFRGGEATGRGPGAAYATVAHACGARFLDAANLLPPGPVDGVHPDASGQRLLGEAIARVVSAPANMSL
jgi:lysophospholipase L1-like esterase